MAHERDPGWQMEIEQDASGAWRRVLWHLPAASIRDALLGAARAGITRAGEPKKEPSVLLLSDVVTLDDQLVATSLILHDQPEQGPVQLDVLVIAEAGWQPALDVRLELSHRTVEAAVAASQATFTGLGKAELTAGLRLVLERRAPSAE